MCLFRWCLALPLCLVLAGCASSYISPLGPLLQQQSTPLRYYQWLSAAPATELRSEGERLKDADAVQESGELALRRGLWLLVSGTEDPALEASLVARLDEYGNAAADAESIALAALAGQQLALRRDLRAIQRKNASATAELQQLRDHNAQLQKQINELTTIEQQLIERELPPSQSKGSP
ncbi:MAG TPA: hypothetical protein VNR18_09060 [Hyphomicrobiales bacterium]|nr:hypothetical protein [Hyphomicrobiales bacterium]